MKVSWDQVRTWRMRRQFLDPRTERSVTEIVGRLCGVQAQVWDAARTAVAVRRSGAGEDGVDRAFTDRALIKTWAMRGTLHLLRPEDAPAYLALAGTNRFWLKPSWQRVSGVTPRQIGELTEKVATVLDGAVLTRDQLVEQLVTDARFAGLEDRLRSGWGQVLKPLAWRGVLCHGPAEGTKVTFTRPASRFPSWSAVPEPDDAAPTVITAYLGAHGPATPEAFDRWLTLGATSRPRLRQWFADLGDTLTEVDVEGRRALMLAEHADALADTRPGRGVRLLGGFDQYILGPGTNDEALLPKQHRAAVSRTSGWISPIVLLDGRVAGVWDIVDHELRVTLFQDSGDLPVGDLEAEVTRIARASGLDQLAVRIA